MPLYPQFQSQYTRRLVTDSFGGLERALRVPEGQWYATFNVCHDDLPALSTRPRRGLTERRAWALGEKKALACVGTDGTLYFNFLPTGLTGLSAGEKQLVSLGAYLCVFPDKKYINTENLSEYGSMEASYLGSASYQPCRADGTPFEAASSAVAPAAPANGDYWVDTSSERAVLRQWSEAQREWIGIESACVKISFSSQGSVPALFAAGDGVTISGSSLADVNGDKLIRALGGGAGQSDWIMVTGLAPTLPAGTESLTLKRQIPALDFVCECQNRLWGCRYGLGEDGAAINEICCSALGDFKNWRRFEGLSSDSWAASVGSDGPWTGAVNYLGYPTFFKENRIHRVTVSAEGAHRVDETVCRGVQRGCSKTLAVVNETLYYKSPADVCAYQGGFPASVSRALGELSCASAAGGAIGGKYYLSVTDQEGQSFLYVYDIARESWLREDDLRALDFAAVDGELYALAADGGTGGRLVALRGSLPTELSARESAPSWYLIGGLQRFEQPDNLRLSRFNLRLRLAAGASAAVYVRYDASLSDDPEADWTLVGAIAAGERDSVDHYVLPVRPRRCDHLQLAIAGSGEATLCSIATLLEPGSDYR